MRHAVVMMMLMLSSTCLIAGCAADRAEQEAAAAAAATRVSFEREGSSTRVLIGGELFTTLVVDGVQKPSLHPVLAPGGQRVSRGFPLEPRENEERDHPHHTSLWFAHGDVNGADFWTNAKGDKIVPQGDATIDEAAGTITASYRWVNAAGRVVCTERRVMRFAGDASVRTIDFNITLTAGDAPITFGDTKEGTFALRVAPELNLKGSVATGSIVNSEGVRDAACWGKRAAWVAYSGVVEGRELGVAIFDHTSNLRHPTWWHARDYGLVAANPFGAHDFEGRPAGTGDYLVGRAQPLRFRYRLLIHDGKWTESQLADAYTEYTSAR